MIIPRKKNKKKVVDQESVLSLENKNKHFVEQQKNKVKKRLSPEQPISPPKKKKGRIPLWKIAAIISPEIKSEEDYKKKYRPEESEIKCHTAQSEVFPEKQPTRYVPPGNKANDPRYQKLSEKLHQIAQNGIRTREDAIISYFSREARVQLTNNDIGIIHPSILQEKPITLDEQINYRYVLFVYEPIRVEESA